MSYKEDIHKEDIIFFPNGLIGYPQMRYFFIRKISDQSLYNYLISVNDLNLNFLIIEPELILDDYQINLTDEDKKKLDIFTGEDLLAYILITLPDETELVSANLKMPILINSNNNRGFHKILVDNYPVKHYIFYEIQELKKKLNLNKNH